MQMVNTRDGKIDSSLQQSMVALMKYAKNLSAKFFLQMSMQNVRS